MLCEYTSYDNINFDYSALGETWSTPRIFRVPLAESVNIMTDRYIAVMGGGMGAGNFCLGLEFMLSILKEVLRKLMIPFYTTMAQEN